MTRPMAVVAAILSLVCLAAGWWLAGFRLVALLCLVLIPASLPALTRRFKSIPGSLLALTILAAGLGIWAGMNFNLGLMAVVFGLAAWDLNGFAGRLAFAAQEDEPGRLERRHTAQLGLSLLVGSGVIVLSRSISYGFSFDWTLLLAILAFLGLAALLGIQTEA